MAVSSDITNIGLQKTKFRFRHKNSINNDNHLPKYYVENSHQAIIDLDIQKSNKYRN